MNLENLRRKRVKRMGIKNSGHAGQRRIFIILDRATRKFHGDVALWMQYIEYARKQKASKKVSKLLTDVLRLHPTRPELWIYAANYALDIQGDINEARSYMQRGLRFCKNSENMWLQYAKLEMIYISKMSAKCQVLGLTQKDRKDTIFGLDDPNADHISIPKLTAAGINSNQDGYKPNNEEALENLRVAPVMTGAIPMAIFDASCKELAGDSNFGEEFFEMVASFEGLPCLNRILDHVVTVLLATAPTSAGNLSCFIRQPLVGIDVASADFPRNLSIALSRLKTSTQMTQHAAALLQCPQLHVQLRPRMVKLFSSFLSTQGLDPDVRRVLLLTVKKTWNQYLIDLESQTDGGADELAELIEHLRNQHLEHLADVGLSQALDLWPENSRLLSINRAE